MVPAVLAAVQIGVSVAQLLGPRGSSVGDLMAIQTAMLKNISSQLSVVQDSINIVLSDIKKLQELVEKIPDETVKVFYQDSIRGGFNQFKQLFREYELRLENSGIETAINEMKPKFRLELLNPIKEKRLTLFNWYNPSHIPLVAYCLQIEIISMLLINEDKERIISILEGYKDWFKHFLNDTNPESLISDYAETKKKQAEIVWKAQNTGLVKICVIEQNQYNEADDSDARAGVVRIIVNEGKIRCQRYEFKRNKSINESDLEKIKPLLEFGLITDGDIPFNLQTGNKINEDVISIVDSVRDRNSPLLNHPLYPSKSSSLALLHGHNCSNVSDTVEAETEESKSISGESESNGISLFALASLVQVTRESLLAVEKFLGDPLLNRLNS